MADQAWEGQEYNKGQVTTSGNWFEPQLLHQVPSIKIEDTTGSILYEGPATARLMKFPVHQGVQTFDAEEILADSPSAGYCFLPGTTSVASQDTAGSKA